MYSASGFTYMVVYASIALKLRLIVIIENVHMDKQVEINPYYQYKRSTIKENDMDYLSREAILNEMNETLRTIMDKYNVDDIGIFEEQGEGNHYYIGYTIRKDDEVFMTHTPYVINDEGLLRPEKQEWVIETDEGDMRGFSSLEEVFEEMDKGLEH